MTAAPSSESTQYSDCYAAICQRLLRQAQEKLHIGDLIQASEEGWGAAAHAIKSVAEKWGWYRQGHYRLNAVVGFIAYERNREDLVTLYLHPTTMHFNYYEHELEADQVQTARNATKVFVDELERIRVEPDRTDSQ